MLKLNTSFSLPPLLRLLLLLLLLCLLSRPAVTGRAGRV
jgi:hypothetical protein